MSASFSSLFSLGLLGLAGIFIASAAYVHFRGAKRHRLVRQISDHSTFMAPYNCLIYLFSAVPNKPIQNLDDFPHLKPLSDHWQIIRDEARRLYEQGQIRSSDNHNDIAFNTFFKRGWRRFYLKWYDDFLPSAKEICPRTVELVESIPQVHAALFALLPARSKLGEHRDPFAGSLRYHLGLVTPNSDDCRIYVDGTPHAWRDGQAVLFDETFIHSVANDTDQDRLILFCDVARPLRTPLVRAINAFVSRNIVKITAAQNRDTEKVGLLNHVSRYIYAVKDLAEKLKKRNRKLYKRLNAAINYGLLLAAAGLIMLMILHHQ